MQVDQERPSGPASLDVMRVDDPCHRLGAVLDVFDQLRVDSIDHPQDHPPGGADGHPHDDGGDGQPGDGVCRRIAERHAEEPHQRPGRYEAVDTGVDAVGLEGDRVDPVADPDLVLGHRLVPDDPDHRRRHREAQVPHRLGPEHRPVGLVGGGCRGQGNDGDDAHAGQVLETVVAERVAAVGSPPRCEKGHPEGNGREDVAEVVQPIGQEGHRAPDRCDGELHGRSRRQAEGGDLDRPDAVGRTPRGTVHDSVVVPMPTVGPVTTSMAAIVAPGVTSRHFGRIPPAFGDPVALAPANG